MPPRDHEQTLVLLLEGEFDLAAAGLLELSLRSRRAGERVRIDFSRVRQFHDLGIAALAQTLAKVDGLTVKLEGLRTHQVRLLRYFGIDADSFGGEQDVDGAG